MLSTVVLIWILIKLQAPVWCFILIILRLFIWIVDLFIE